MKRSTSILLILILTGIFLGSSKIETFEQPNILWLTSEDNNIDWVGCYGNPFAETPNIDALSREGFRYTHCYANAPVCALNEAPGLPVCMPCQWEPIRCEAGIPFPMIW